MDADDGDGRWVTTKDGNHMFINGEGEPTKGNPHVLAAAKGESKLPTKEAEKKGSAEKSQEITAESRMTGKTITIGSIKDRAKKGMSTKEKNDLMQDAMDLAVENPLSYFEVKAALIRAGLDEQFDWEMGPANFNGFEEMIKPAYQQPIDCQTLSETLAIFEDLMKVIHPFMPFITEELYQHIAERKPGESIMISPLTLDAPSEGDRQLLEQFDQAKQIISGVRAVRQSKNIAQREPLTLEVVKGQKLGLTTIIQKMAGLSAIQYVEKKSEGTQAFLVGTQEYAVPLGNLIDAEAEARKAEAEIQRLQGFMAGIEKKLQNERFVQNAPAQVVELERKKVADAQSKIAALQETLRALKG